MQSIQGNFNEWEFSFLDAGTLTFHFSIIRKWIEKRTHSPCLVSRLGIGVTHSLEEQRQNTDCYQRSYYLCRSSSKNLCFFLVLIINFQVLQFFLHFAWPIFFFFISIYAVINDRIQFIPFSSSRRNQYESIRSIINFEFNLGTDNIIFLTKLAALICNLQR